MSLYPIGVDIARKAGAAGKGCKTSKGTIQFSAYPAAAARADQTTCPGAHRARQPATRTLSKIVPGLTIGALADAVPGTSGTAGGALAAGARGGHDVRNHQMPWGVHRQGGFVDPFDHISFVGDRSPLERCSGSETS